MDTEKGKMKIEPTEKRSNISQIPENLRVLETAIKNAGNAIAITDNEGKFLWVNQSFVKLTGYEPEELAGKKASVLKSGVHSRDFYQNLWSTITTGKVWQGDMVNQRKDGSFYNEHNTISPVFDENGTISHFISIKEDITELTVSRKKLEEYAAKQTTLLREVNHRVKNNLSSIISILNKEAEVAEMKGESGYVPFLDDLINRIQGLSKVHSLLSANNWEPVELKELVRDISLSALQGVPVGKSIKLEVSGYSLPVSSEICHNLTLIINEIATNCIKHGLKKRDELNLTVNIQKTNANVIISLSDDGNGFPEEITKKDYSNVNIGLQLIIGIVEHSLGGEISFRNEGGAEVTMIIPIEKFNIQ